jgi:hypothetical protein
MFIGRFGPATTGTALRTAAVGVERARATLDETARGLAQRPSVEPGDLAVGAVRMLETRTQLRASAKVMTTADQMLGTLVDLRA